MALGKKCKMISLDTSTSATGYAIFQNGVLKKCNEISFDKIRDSEKRFEQMCLTFFELFKKEHPDIVVVEMTVISRNAGTQRILSELVGVIRGYCIMHQIEFVRLRPTEWRSLVKDEDEIIPKGRYEKKMWAIGKVKSRYGLSVMDNAAEAALIGLARTNQFKKFGVEE